MSLRLATLEISVDGSSLNSIFKNRLNGRGCPFKGAPDGVSFGRYGSVTEIIEMISVLLRQRPDRDVESDRSAKAGSYSFDGVMLARLSRVMVALVPKNKENI